MADTDRVHLIAEFDVPANGDAFVDQFFQDCVNLQVAGAIIRTEGQVIASLEGAPNDVQTARDDFMKSTELVGQVVTGYEGGIEGKLTALVTHLPQDVDDSHTY